MSKSRNARKRTQSWWRTSKGRNKVWFVLLPALAFAAVGGLAWLSLNGGHTGSGGESPIPIGHQVQSFQLPNVVSGRDFSLSDDLGKKKIVVVGYMGFY